jgi:polyphenol oxidase
VNATPALPLLRPHWPAPAGVGAAMSTRDGGVSAGPWRALNLGRSVGDEAAAVAANRERFATALGAQPVWLRQVHGHHVLRLHGAGARDEPADAAWTDVRGVACTVLVADCMPVLFAATDGRAVAAAHAGWRGLAGGVLEATLSALESGAGAAPAEIVAWLGPCIGPRAFEVGADVLQAFGRAAAPQDHDAFAFRPRSDGSPRWRADLARLAQQRLAAAGVQRIAVDGRCTVEDASAFFSFRRDGVCGRHAAAVWRV